MILKNGQSLCCPKCGGTTFIATAHVTQDWRIDTNGDFQECVSECVEVTHEPDQEDILTCTNCGYDASGEEFIVTKN